MSTIVNINILYQHIYRGLINLGVRLYQNFITLSTLSGLKVLTPSDKLQSIELLGEMR